jgi:hypothetical protein
MPLYPSQALRANVTYYAGLMAGLTIMFLYVSFAVAEKK